MGDKLTSKQSRFVEEYLIDLNATQAALRAGYSPTSARESGCENLARSNIADAIAVARARLSQRVEITQDMVVREFAKLGFSDIRRIFDETGALRPVSALTSEEAAAIASIEVVTKTIPGRDGEAAQVEHTHKIRAWDKVAALTQIGRHLGMFTDNSNVKITGDFIGRLEAARVRAKRRG